MISLRASGGETVLRGNPLVSGVVEHSDETEVFLNDGADAQQLLKELVDAGSEVSKFEYIEPSLNDIFIEKVS